MQICPENKCTGCYACVNACQKNCITMQEDKYGELHPIVDETSCKHCNLCVKSCPNNIEMDFNYPAKCYASWITDKEKRKICASGGIGTIMSEYAIKERKGVVFGSRYDKDFTPIMTYTDNVEELERFKGSRYTQSIVGENTFRQVKRFLIDRRFVLFIGTPCQIAGLKAFLNCDYENLVTVDLICHGVCPTKYFKEEINEISRQKGLSDLSDVRFRGNDGKNYCLTFWSDKRSDNSRCVYKKPASRQYYFAGFLLGVSLRENCFSCNYARPERISDITIGDFIGLGNKVPFNYPSNNVSSVTTNTNKGFTFYRQISELWGGVNCLINVERNYEERLEYKPSLMIPFPKNKLNPVFRKKYLEMGYYKAIRLTLRGYVRLNIVRNYMNIPRKVLRKILHFIKNKKTN